MLQRGLGSHPRFKQWGQERCLQNVQVSQLKSKKGGLSDGRVEGRELKVGGNSLFPNPLIHRGLRALVEQLRKLSEKTVCSEYIDEQSVKGATGGTFNCSGHCRQVSPEVNLPP